MARQSRNDRCGCGSGKKFKKCCGRFTLEQLSSKLAAFAASNNQKNKLIEHSLKFLKACEINGSGAVLVLVDPVVKEEIYDWTCVGGRNIPQDEREAIVTRRILAGYLPTCCLVEDNLLRSGWRAVVDGSMVPAEYRDEFIAFARSEAVIVGQQFKDALSGAETSVTPVRWEERTYPGLPPKKRPAGIIRIEVDIQRRTISTVWSMLGAQQFPIRDEHITENDAEDVLYIARQVVAALERIDPPGQLVDGDDIEVWQAVQDGETKLLAGAKVSETSTPVQNKVGVAGGADAN
jgi:hypothetical protein